MKSSRYDSLLWMGLTGSLIFGTVYFDNIYRAFWGDQTIWWTPRAMSLTIEETKNDFELYIGGSPLNRHLSERTLLAVDKSGNQNPVVAKDISVRLNNWNRTKSSILADTAGTGFVFGFSFAMLVIGLIQFIRCRMQSRNRM